MKPLRQIAIFVFLLSAIAVAQTRAQTPPPPRVAFVASNPLSTNPTVDDRAAIYIVDAAGNLTTSTFFSGAAAQQAHATNLSVLAATSDGKSLIVGGHFTFPNFLSTLPDSMDAIVRLDAPFTVSNLNDLYNGKLVVLKVLEFNQSNNIKPSRVIPTGVVTDDNRNWYATWTVAQPGSPKLWFYHGSMTGNDFLGTATIDSIEYGAGNNGQGLVSDYHMTNLAASPDGGSMIAVVVDNLANQTNGAKFHAVTWQPHPAIVGQGFSSRDFSNSVIAKFNSSTATIDYNMGFGIRSERDGATADFIMDNDVHGDLVVMSYNYLLNASPSLSGPGLTISKGILPAGEYFFDFIPGSSLTQQPEQVSTALQRGNGGDIRFIGGSDSLVFVTHQLSESGDQSKSELYLYDGANAIPLYNFTDKQEIDPVFLAGTPVAPPPPPTPGYITTSIQSLNFGTHGVPGDSTLSVVFQNPSGKSVEVNSATITGQNAGDFTIVSSTKPALPLDSLKAGDSIGFTIHYVASKPTHVSQATLTVKFANSDSNRTVTLSGTSKDTASNVGVDALSKPALELSVSPNPFTSTTKITLQTAQSGMMNVEVRDVLGRLVYAAKPELMGAGELRTVTFDAASLGLSDGVYYLSVHAGNSALTRRMVLVH